jgi:ammonia channel protein AmtB
MAFVALWSIFVYCPLAHWVWAPSGWLFQLGLLDFAGGTVVESASGVSAFVLAFWLGASPKRHTVNPHNVPYILLGAAILWFGWFGFNAGGGIASSAYGGRLMANTHMAASMAMMTWGALEWAFPLNEPFFSGRPTSIGAACGAVVGLVAITPACGYVTIMWGAYAVMSPQRCFPCAPSRFLSTHPPFFLARPLSPPRPAPRQACSSPSSPPSPSSSCSATSSSWASTTGSTFSPSTASRA